MKRICSIGCAVSAIAISSVLGASPLAAQSTDATAAPTQSEASASTEQQGHGEIVVTALKRSESLQRVPAAVTAVTNEALTKLGVVSLTQLPSVAPGIQITPIRNQAFIFLRGVGQTLTAPNADPAIAVNINGVYTPSEMTAGAFFDVERIEVLPGPQGTLYGRNAAGGVVNLLTKQPGSDLAVDGFIEIGNYDRLQAVMGVNLPIVPDTLAVRVAGTIVKHDGYATNGLDDQDTYAGRVTAVLTPSAGTKITGIVTQNHDGGYGILNYNKPAIYDPDDIRVLNFDPRSLNLGTDFDTTQASLEASQELNDHVTLTYIGGYNHLDAFQRAAAFGGPPPAVVQNYYVIKSSSHELRVNADYEGLRIVAGGYYFDSNADYSAEFRPLPTVRSLSGPFKAESSGEAIFAQVTVPFGDLRITAGGRYSHVKKEVEGTNGSGFEPNVVITPYAGEQSLSRGDWKVGLEYDVMPSTLLYANFSTGFSPGGLSTAPAVTGQLAAAPFEPVTLQAYTAGIKNQFFGNKLTVNVEGFYYDYKNYQVSARNPITLSNIVYNAEKAEIYGAQADVHFRPTRNDDFSLSVVRLHAKAVELVTPACNCNGYDLPYSPNWTLNASYSHTFDLGPSGSLDASANFGYTSSWWLIYNHPAGTQASDYTKTDLNLEYRPPSRNWSLSVWVRNLEDEDVPMQAFAGAVPGPNVFSLRAPRTYGARFSFDFGS